jgi:hypothetical protein
MISPDITTALFNTANVVTNILLCAIQIKPFKLNPNLVSLPVNNGASM